jgi:hypothetical protein
MVPVAGATRSKILRSLSPDAFAATVRIQLWCVKASCARTILYKVNFPASAHLVLSTAVRVTHRLQSIGM